MAIPAKKDTSGFGGRPYLSGEQFRQWLRSPDLWGRTGIPESKRLELGKTIGQKWGAFLEKGEPEKIIRELEMGRLKPPTGVTKERTIRLLKEFLGKK